MLLITSLLQLFVVLQLSTHIVGAPIHGLPDGSSALDARGIQQYKGASLVAHTVTTEAPFPKRTVPAIPPNKATVNSKTATLTTKTRIPPKILAIYLNQRKRLQALFASLSHTTPKSLPKNGKTAGTKRSTPAPTDPQLQTFTTASGVLKVTDLEMPSEGNTFTARSAFELNAALTRLWGKAVDDEPAPGYGAIAFNAEAALSEPRTRTNADVTHVTALEMRNIFDKVMKWAIHEGASSAEFTLERQIGTEWEPIGYFTVESQPGERAPAVSTD